MVKLRSPSDLERHRLSLQRAGGGARRQIVITTHSTCCQLRGSQGVVEAFQAGLERAGLQEAVAVRLSGCLGFCEIEPMVLIGAPVSDRMAGGGRRRCSTRRWPPPTSRRS